MFFKTLKKENTQVRFEKNEKLAVEEEEEEVVVVVEEEEEVEEGDGSKIEGNRDVKTQILHLGSRIRRCSIKTTIAKAARRTWSRRSSATSSEV